MNTFELIQALRYCATGIGDHCEKCPAHDICYSEFDNGQRSIDLIAADQLEALQAENERLKALNPPSPPALYDFQICHSNRELRDTVDRINRDGYELVSVCQRDYFFIVFFRRRACW